MKRLTRLTNTLMLALTMLTGAAAEGRAADKSGEAIRRLEESLARKGDYEQAKEARIQKLRTNLLQTKSAHARFQLTIQLYDEYKSYKYDSAHHYATESLLLAERLERPDYLVKARCAVVFCLLSSGLYKEAYDVMEGIDVTGVSQEYRDMFYGLASRLYYDMADYNHDVRYQDEYIKRGSAYADSVLKRLQPNTTQWLYNTGMKQMKEYHYDDCAFSFHQLLRHDDVSQRMKAIVLSCLGWISIYNGERDEAKAYLAEAAIADNENTTKETTALTMLSQLCYQDGDIERATRFVQLSLDDANFYDARQRKIQIGDILPIIEQDRYNVVKNERNAMIAALVAALLAIIILLIGTYIVRRQMKKLQQARLIIEQRNQALEQTNNQLCEANAIKDEYIGRSFYINAEYINKVEKLYKTVDHKIAARQFEDLRNSLKESTLDAERKSMCADFDETFLKLFPDFVGQFNQLFEEKDRRQPENAKSLTSEMRIFALIRLGIADSERIAKFLDYSVHTINTYKTRVKNKSIVENDLFEQRIMEIS